MLTSQARKRRVVLKLDLEEPYRCNLDVFAGCQQYAAEVEWDCMINPFADRVLSSKRETGSFDGVLAHGTEPLVKAARRTGVPIVNVSVDAPRGVPSVIPDCRAAGAMAAEHLLGRGFRQFGFLGFSRNLFSRRQREGFHSALNQEGFPCTDHSFGLNSYIASAKGWETFIAGLNAWVDTWTSPIGLYVTEDLPCRYLIEVCQSRGLQVPQDVAIVGSHNDEVICNSSSPSLTSIDHGYFKVGYRAAAMLGRLMKGRKSPSSSELVPPAELVFRQSTDSFAVDDPLVSRALNFIAAHSHEPMGVIDVANNGATTRRTLERRFRQSLDRSISEEITRFRLERAKRRMVESDAALDWKWEIIQQDAERCAVRMSSIEPLTGLRHQITYAADPNQESLETEIMVHNPSDQEVAFSHWTTATLAPSGRGEVTPQTEIIVPADSFVPDDRDFNAWMEGMTGTADKSPLRWVGKWKEIGDLMATPLHDPYFAVYSHELDSGLVRTFDRNVTPGFDIWGLGYPPSEKRQREFTDQLPTTGYIEIWNGTTLGYSCDTLSKIDAGESIQWTERMFSVSGLKHASNLRDEVSKRSKAALAGESKNNDLIESIDLQTIATGKPEVNWFQWRPALIPGTPSTVLVTTQELRPSQTHGYYDIFAFTSQDGGNSWTEPKKVPSLQRVRQANDFDRVAGDLWLSWHPQSKRVLATGKTFHFAQGKREDNQREEVSYAVYNPSDQSWSGLKTVTLPETDSSGQHFVTPNAGCNQPVVLGAGDILLPIRYQKHPDSVNYTTTVARCTFDG